MSQPAFQAALARLLLDRDFRDGVRAQGESGLDGELTDVERRRLVAVASDRGLDITRTLHDGWRLSKALLMLPGTCGLLGERRLARELRSFWRARVPRSLYFADEAIAFCDHLLQRRREGLRVAYLGDVVALERATLELRRPWLAGPPAPRLVRLRHDPELLLAALAAGVPPRHVPVRPRVLVGMSPAPGKAEWRLVERDAEAAVVRAASSDAETLELTPALS